jgi:hypothetical protein
VQGGFSASSSASKLATILWLIRREYLAWIESEVFSFRVVMLSELFEVSALQILRDVRATLDSAGKP